MDALLVDEDIGAEGGGGRAAGFNADDVGAEELGTAGSMRKGAAIVFVELVELAMPVDETSTGWIAAVEEVPPLMVPVGTAVAIASGNIAVHERIRFASFNDLPCKSVISPSPTKFPQNTCAELVEKTAEFMALKADGDAPVGRSGFPSAFWTLSQLPRHAEG